MKRILFVDDEIKVLEGLQRMLYPLRNEWDMVFVSSGRDALERLSQAEFDVLVTDVRMPEMSGIELLSHVIEHHPQVVRIVLSGTADQEMTLRSVTLAHQYLPKPCDARTLRSRVEQAVSFQGMLENPFLQRLISRIQSLPSVPAVYLKLMEAVQSPDVSAKEIGAIVAQDPGMSAKVLQLVNSAFFGMSHPIVTPAEATIYLGVDTVKALALSVSAFSQFNGQTLSHFSIEKLQAHSLEVGFLARNIARSLGQSKPAMEDAFVGGLLHDIGELVLASTCPDQYREVQRRTEEDLISHREAELAVFGTAHDVVASYLLWLWGLPESVTQLVALHHQVPGDPALVDSPVLAVHLADELVSASREQDRYEERLAALGLIDHLPVWKRFRDEVMPERPRC